jgi:hypothetical protein
MFARYIVPNLDIGDVVLQNMNRMHYWALTIFNVFIRICYLLVPGRGVPDSEGTPARRLAFPKPTEAGWEATAVRFRSRQTALPQEWCIRSYSDPQ